MSKRLIKQRHRFRLIYLLYLGVLVALVAAAVLYVGSLLRQYEESQPQRHAENAAAALVSDAADGTFWSKYNLPDVTPGPLEQNRDVRSEYLTLYTGGALTCSPKIGTHAEDELFYTVSRDGFPLAEVKLKAAGPTVTKLAILSIREWNVESITPLLEEHTYTMTVPNTFVVQVNGIKLTPADGQAKDTRCTTYTLSGLYLKPELKITDQAGTPAQYALKTNRIAVEYFDYSLTLPSALTVTLNGEVYTGESIGENRVQYDITSLTKPTVTISDHFGNTVNYEGGNALPLTMATIIADETYTVQVQGSSVPQQAVSTRANPEYIHFIDFVENLPGLCTYDIAVLQDDAKITVTDPLGNPVALDPETNAHDLTGHMATLDTVPAAVSEKVDVLQVAQNWSLFLTRDLPFAQVVPSLISSSYQYEVAYKYAHGIDITFTSKHTLMDPPFTDTSVENFTWITDDCFSVDISFVKHMILTRTGEEVTDPMNDRFYFVNYDDTNDGVDNPTWLLASMKEIIHDTDA